jgi:hypothetical protein
MQTETQVKREITKTLERFGVWVERIHTGMVPVGGRWIHGARTGTPDTVVISPPGWLEVKRPGEEPSPEQVDWHEKARKAGHRVAVVHSAQEAVRVVMEWRKADTKGANHE